MTPRSGLMVLAVLAFLNSVAVAQDAVVLAETFRDGTLYKVSARTQLEGTLRPPAEKGKAAPAPIRMEGTSAMEYEERVLGLGTDNLVNKTIRLVQRMEVKRTLGGQDQQNVLRPAVRRLVVLRDRQAKAPFSPDGALTWAEIDLVRTDVLVPLLVGLLPGKAVTVGATWPATAASVQELTGLEKVNAGGLDCTFSSIQTRDGHRQARVDFKGKVSGTNEDGRSQQEIEGYYLFDLEAGALGFLSLNGTHSLVGQDGKEMGRINGRFVLQREVLREVPGLTPAALARLNLIPGPVNTELLFDNAELGVKFRFSRRWRVTSIKGRQVTLDTPEGHGLLVTVEPLATFPTATAYLRESRGWLEKQRATIQRVNEPKIFQASPALEYFGLAVKLDDQPAQMDYYLARQAGGGVLLAARLAGMDQDAARLEVERIARSVVVTKKVE